jgi:hypothetical protein
MQTFAPFKVGQLKLDQDNYRLGSFKSQPETIAAMLAHPKAKLLGIAKDIVEMGLSPGDPIWVMPDPKEAGKYIVLEGNRRITTLRILETPALASHTTDAADWRDLHKKYLARGAITDVMALVFPDRKTAKPWIKRRHMYVGSGVGVEGWVPDAKARAMRDEGEAAPRFLAVQELLRDETPEWEAIEESLKSRWTTVDRVLNSKSLPKLLGVHIDATEGEITFENGNEQAGKSLLRDVLGTMAKPGFKFAHIENKGDRENFLKRFTSSSVKAPAGQPGSGGTKVKAKTASTGSGSTRAKRDTLDRLTLAPKSGPHMLPVTGPRLNPMYAECRKIKVENNENAAALLLRVFIELSSEALLRNKRVPIPQKLKEKGKKDWGDFGISLAVKVNCVADILDTSKKDKRFQQVRLATEPNANSYYSVATLHGYFHNVDLLPDAKDLKRAWNAWERYLFEVHSTLNPEP